MLQHTTKRFSASLSWAKSVRYLTTTQVNNGGGDYLKVKEFSSKKAVVGINVLQPDQKEKLEDVRNMLFSSDLEKDQDGEVHYTSFGRIRYDSENRVTYTGEYEHRIKRRSRNIDFSQYEKRLPLNEMKEASENKLPELPQDNDLTEEVEEKEYDALKKDYPGTIKRAQVTIDWECFKKYVDSSHKNKSLKEIKFAFTNEWLKFKLMNPPESDPDAELYRDLKLDDPNIFEMITFAADSPLRSANEVALEIARSSHFRSLPREKEEEEEEEEEEGLNREYDEIKSSPSSLSPDQSATGPVKVDQSTPEPSEAVPLTALEYVQKIRQGLIEPVNKEIVQKMNYKYQKLGSNLSFKKYRRLSKDSKGFRIYTNATPNLYHFRRDEILRDLANRVIFNDCDIIAIDKPYGMIVSGATGKNQDLINLQSYLPELAKLLRVENLYKVHRIDRDATGVVLLATTESMVSTLQAMFAEKKVTKYYWAILINGLANLSATIDIPLEQIKMNGKERMGLRPYMDEDFNRTMRPKSKVYPAVTHYRVLRQAGNAVLVEVRPEQGVKHQIRAHFGLGLRAPILGDHKYSYLHKIAPQKLLPDLLDALKVRQQKVRTIPMHLHAKLVVLPEIGHSGTNIFIPAHTPGFFTNTMSLLRLSREEAKVKKSEIE